MSRKSILFISDEHETLKGYNKYFMTLKDLVILTALDGTEAYRKSRNQKFDCIVTNYTMPKLSGLQLIRALRENTLNTDSPIYIVVDNDEEEVKSELKNEKLYYNIKVCKKPMPQASLEEINKLLTNSLVTTTTTTFNFDLGFLNSYVNALESTLKDFARIDRLVAEKPYLMKGDTSVLVDISAGLSIVSSHFTGNISIGFPELTFLNLAEEVLCEKQTSINKENRDLVAELVNIIYGKAKRTWSDLGFSFEKTIPSVFDGNTHQLRPMVDSSTIILPYQSSFGVFTAVLSIRKNKTNSEG